MTRVLYIIIFSEISVECFCIVHLISKKLYNTLILYKHALHLYHTIIILIWTEVQKYAL